VGEVNNLDLTSVGGGEQHGDLGQNREKKTCSVDFGNDGRRKEK
jgi:hypothetical protein